MKVTPIYIASEANPADEISRIKWNEIEYDPGRILNKLKIHVEMVHPLENSFRYNNQEELFVKTEASRISLSLKRQSSKSEKLLAKR
ncbi:hypothetical protein BpHYR1_010093 [Brachionus plicatilis]|uniref:Uncharacterized protein n=1 Tax=Brachionus plicatilis TaxID=10195 RepID=A0A3M7QT41_BRAPC|nr:hypothetical protein BpHYR1_010093 [Brachionus plicatilis]